MSKKSNNMQAMIFAAGLGTRLKPLTDHMPKALVKVGGEPLLHHVLTRLSAAGYTRLVVNVHHFADQITDYLRANDNFGLDISISDESERLLETGGGIRRAWHLLRPDGSPVFDHSQPVLIHNVDILSNVDLREWAAAPSTEHSPLPSPLSPLPQGEAADVSARLLVSERQTKRYLLFDDDMRMVGWTNRETGEVRSPYPGIDPAHCRQYAFSGIHQVMPSLMPLMDEEPERFPIMDFYIRNCSRVRIQGVLKSDLQLIDVGKLDSLQKAEDFLLRE